MVGSEGRRQAGRKRLYKSEPDPVAWRRKGNRHLNIGGIAAIITGGTGGEGGRSQKRMPVEIRVIDQYKIIGVETTTLVDNDPGSGITIVFIFFAGE
jgi:hypothetical protein